MGIEEGEGIYRRVLLGKWHKEAGDVVFVGTAKSGD